MLWNLQRLNSFDQCWVPHNVSTLQYWAIQGSAIGNMDSDKDHHVKHNYVPLIMKLHGMQIKVVPFML